VSEQETYSQIRATLDAINALPANGTISERIKNLHGELLVSLAQRGEQYAKEHQYADACRLLFPFAAGTLPEMVQYIIDKRAEAIAQRDEQVHARSRAESAHAAAIVRAEAAELALVTYENADANMRRDLREMRAERDALRAKLKYATQLLTTRVQPCAKVAP
jgi:pheromone shutdown protein TraB